MGLKGHRREEENIFWNVIYTRSRQEKKVTEKLMALGYEVYLPLIKVISQWSDRKKEIEKPLFNSYIFIKETIENDVVKTIKGVVGFLKYNNKLANVKQHEIETLRSIIKFGYDVSEFNQNNEFSIGTRVIVMAGPLKGNIGELYSQSESDWLVIHFENIGNSIQVKLPSKILKKIDE